MEKKKPQSPNHVDCSMALNRMHIEEYVNHPKNRRQGLYAIGVELPVVSIRINGKTPKKLATAYVQAFAIAIYVEEQAQFKLSGITTLN